MSTDLVVRIPRWALSATPPWPWRELVVLGACVAAADAEGRVRVSVRDLAAMLDRHHTRVSETLSRLASRGVLEVVPGARGTTMTIRVVGSGAPEGSTVAPPSAPLGVAPPRAPLHTARSGAPVRTTSMLAAALEASPTREAHHSGAPGGSTQLVPPRAPLWRGPSLTERAPATRVRAEGAPHASQAATGRRVKTWE